MRIQGIARLSTLILLATLTFVYTASTLASTANNPAEQILNMDPQSLQNLEHEIQNIVSQMSQEEQQQFHQDVEELTGVMSNMSDKELENFINDIFTADMPEGLPEKPKPEPKKVTPAKEPVKPAVKPIEKPEPRVTKKQDEAYLVVNAIVRRTNSFLLKAQIYPGMAEKVEKWANDKKIEQWPTGMTWQKFKAQLELLVQKLKQISSKDPKTQKYKHIDAILADEALYNNLKKIKSSLVEKEPIIEQSPFGLEKTSKESKAAMRAVLGIYAEAFYLLKISEAIDKVIAKYEPTVKALREEEEAAAKKALEEAKKARPAVPVTTAGAAAEAAPSYGYDYGYDSGYYDDYGYRAPYYAPKYRPTPEYPAKKPAPTTPEKKAAKEEPSGIVARKEDPALKRLLNTINNNLESAAALIDLNPDLRGIKRHITSAGAVNQKIVSDLPQIIRYLTVATRAIEDLKTKTKTMSAQTQKNYTDQVNAMYRGHKTTFDSLSEQVRSIREDEGKISPAKKQAYLGIKSGSAMPLKTKMDVEGAVTPPAPPPLPEPTAKPFTPQEQTETFAEEIARRAREKEIARRVREIKSREYITQGEAEKKARAQLAQEEAEAEARARRFAPPAPTTRAVEEPRRVTETQPSPKVEKPKEKEVTLPKEEMPHITATNTLYDLEKALQQLRNAVGGQ